MSKNRKNENVTNQKSNQFKNLKYNTIQNVSKYYKIKNIKHNPKTKPNHKSKNKIRFNLYKITIYKFVITINDTT